MGFCFARVYAGFCFLFFLFGFFAWVFLLGKYYCSVLFIVFINNIYIVVVRIIGNVYVYEVGFWGLCGI